MQLDEKGAETFLMWKKYYSMLLRPNKEQYYIQNIQIVIFKFYSNIDNILYL